MYGRGSQPGPVRPLRSRRDSSASAPETPSLPSARPSITVSHPNTASSEIRGAAHINTDKSQSSHCHSPASGKNIPYHFETITKD